MKNANNRGRPRGRNMNGKRPPNRNQVFDSNGPGVRVRGNAQQLVEKYLAMARDASSQGDRVLAENCHQHADHYQRVLNALTGRYIKPDEHQQPSTGMDDDDFGDEDDGGDGSFFDPTGEQPREYREPREQREPREPREQRGRGGRRGRQDRQDRQDRPDRQERQERQDRQDRQDRPDRAPVAAEGEAQPRSEETPSAEAPRPERKAKPAPEVKPEVSSEAPSEQPVTEQATAETSEAAEKPARPRRRRRTAAEIAEAKAAKEAAKSGESSSGDTADQSVPA